MRTYSKNESLLTIKKNYPGNRLKLGRFVNEYKGPLKASIKESIQHFIYNHEQKKANNGNGKKLPTKKITKIPIKDSITWLGHAGFLIVLNGEKIVIDPHLTKFFPIKRIGEAPITPKKIGTIDYFCLTHAHRDHFDEDTIHQMDIKEALIPLGGEKLFKKFNKKAKIQTAGWWQKFKTKKINIYFLPAYHWSARWITDTNKILWGSFIIQSKKKTIYCAGDTGYTKHFKEIKKYFPKIDVCIMPTTIYKPDFLAASEHMPIKKSMEAFEDLKGEKFIPMHFGTFKLGQGSIKTTIRETKHYFTKRTKKEGILQFLFIGETHNI